MTESEWMLIGELARELQCDPRTVRRIIKAGVLKARRLRPRAPRQVSRAEFERYKRELDEQ